jgi:integrase/recombinase XerD
MFSISKVLPGISGEVRNSWILDAVREYEIYLLEERKISPESVNTFVSAAKFLYLETLAMPWGSQDFPRVKRPHKLPVVLSLEEMSNLFAHVPSLKYRAALMLCYGAGLRIREAASLKVADIGDVLHSR